MQKEKQELLKAILVDLDIISTFRRWFNNPEEKLEELIGILSSDNYRITDFKGISEIRRRALFAECFPERDIYLHRNICKYLLHMYDIRECKSCNRLLSVSDFRPNSSRSDGLNGQCKTCQSNKTKLTQPARQAVYKAKGIERIVPWTNMQEISKFYSMCPEGYHVDHVVPMQGELVSGLHVLANLQYLSAYENIKKHNKFIAE